MARRTRRLWTDEEKRSICLQTATDGVSVAQVALRYTVNANLIFKWLRDPKYRPAPRTGSEEAGLRFLPVEIVAEARVPAAAPVTDSCIEIELAGGLRMRISGGYDHHCVARVLAFHDRPCTRSRLQAMSARSPFSWVMPASRRPRCTCARTLTNSNAAHEYEAGHAPNPTSGTRPQRAVPHAINPLPARPAIAQGIVARMGGDCPAGSSRDDQSPVPALPGCAIALPFSDLAIECVVRRGHLSCHLSALSRM